MDPIPMAEPVSEPPPQPGTTHGAGQSTDAGRGRVFPCQQCGADLHFHIGTQGLKCPYCGYQQQLEVPEGAAIAEQDLEAMLQKLASWRSEGRQEQQVTSEVRCESCGANVVFIDTLTSLTCPYCDSPVQRDRIHSGTFRIPVDGVLPFAVDKDRASQRLKEWVQSRWFAPDEFRKRGAEGKFTGIYLPYWTYDAMTFTRYSGKRGDHYYVTVGVGKNRRQERRTRWSSASGSFQHFFDDVLVLAGKHLPSWLSIALEPWALKKCLPYTPDALVGFLAQTYDTPLDQGFNEAKQRMEQALAANVRQRIGGDEQVIHRIETQYSALTYKHLLLPAWLLSYRFHDKVFQVAVNASTGEVQGERPYSWVKITLAVLGGALLAGVIGLIVAAMQR